MTTQHLEGKTALVTGAGRGLGRAIAEALAAEGAHVVLVARTRAELERAVAAIEATGGSAAFVVADVATSEGIATVIDAVRATPVDVLVNNAASLGGLRSTVEIGRADWEQLLALNLLAAVGLTSRLLPGMLERGWGRIVNVSAGIASRPDAMLGANVYAVSKAALEAHTINLAAELGDATGVTLNVFRPGMLDTSMQQAIRDQPAASGVVDATTARFVEAHRTGQLSTPERSAASLVPHLATDETGAVWAASN